MEREILRQIAENNWMSVIYTDLNGIVLFANKAADELHGYEKGELLGKPVWILSSGGEQGFKRINVDLLNDGWHGEVLRIRKNETQFPAQLTVWKIHNIEGKHIGYASNCRDISAEKFAIAELAAEKERITSIINNTDDDICSLNERFELVDFNAALAAKVRRLGFELKSGMSIFQILPPHSHDMMRDIYYRVMLGEKVMRIDEYQTRTNGMLYYESFYNPIKVAGKVIGLAVFSRNITERVKKEKLIESTLKERELLLAEVHHRVKNNLAIVSGFLQLEEYNTESPEVKELLRDSKTRIKTTALVHELLYKNESLSHIDINKYIQDLVRLISATYFSPQNNIRILTDIAPVNFNIEKAISIGLVLNEIISNSYKHAFDPKENGEIHIALRADEEDCIIIISDTGKGMPEHFDFANSTQTGTLLVKTFVEQIGGEIEVGKNQLPDGTKKGTRYVLSFKNEQENSHS